MALARQGQALTRVIAHSRPSRIGTALHVKSGSLLPQRVAAARRASTEPTAGGDSAIPPPPPPPQASRWSRFLMFLGKSTLFTMVLVGGTYYYVNTQTRHPGKQLPFDSTKKTVVVIGSGWGATSWLRSVDNTEFNVIVISPKNYFLFTPLLPSVAVGTLSPRSILQPTRFVTRHKPRQVQVIEAEATDVDPVNKTVTFADNTPVRGAVSSTTIGYDYLVYAPGAEVQTFNIPGIKEKACFMKELADAERLQDRFMDCLESAAFPGQSDAEIDRLLHVVVVGGGPTGVEVAGEFHDFLEDDLKAWYPELAQRIRITLVEALPSVLPMFSKQLIDYTEESFKESKIDIMTKTMVKEVKDEAVVLQMPDKSIVEVPCGVVVWAAGNRQRQITMNLMKKLGPEQDNRRGLTVDDYMQVKGSNGSIFSIGDTTATSYAPTAQVASQEGAYLARVFSQMGKKDALERRLAELKAEEGKALASPEAEKVHKEEIESVQSALQKVKIRPFSYSHQGSLAYIGSEKAIADLPFMNGNFASGGMATYLFWRSAYLTTLFSLRNRTLVAVDWMRTKVFGRDVSRE
ncbi:FAD/NAD(P)-binding domain-containing protein [Schizophyllum commune Tattone D]|nr:FAD/NAD(P)-binding domain-containing protein [Schizophyllum commune Loenen D]KAI5825477.1 FAD/NAD(P)-binding domain-containing protein [Schizophyllum commune Tattone D]